MNRKLFYEAIRKPLFGIKKMKQTQVDGMEALLNATEHLTDPRHQAYILATAYHETAKTMQPIEEYGKGKGYDYGRMIKRNRNPYAFPDKLFYGRGLVQLTWYENYEYMGRKLGIDLLNHPELALQMDISCRIIVTGMTRGMFTGVKLETYFNDDREDWEQARKIVNGMDCAEKIAGYARIFYRALTEL